MKRMVHIMISSAVAFLVLLTWANAAVDPLGERIQEIDRQRNGLATETSRLEDDCRKLMAEQLDDVSRGRVAAELVLVHAQNGLRDPEKTAAVCAEALRYPLDPATRARVRVYWADALQVRRPGGASTFPARRRAAARVCLEGIQEILARSGPQEVQEVPLITRYEVSDPAQAEELQLENRRQVAAWEQAMLANEFVYNLRVLSDKCLWFYSQRPSDALELERLALDIVRDREFVRDLMNRVH